MRSTWPSAVRLAITSRCAISRFDRPLSISSATSSSRLVSGALSRGRRGGGRRPGLNTKSMTSSRLWNRSRHDHDRQRAVGTPVGRVASANRGQMRPERLERCAQRPPDMSCCHRQVGGTTKLVAVVGNPGAQHDGKGDADTVAHGALRLQHLVGRLFGLIQLAQRPVGESGRIIGDTRVRFVRRIGRTAPRFRCSPAARAGHGRR